MYLLYNIPTVLVTEYKCPDNVACPKNVNPGVAGNKGSPKCSKSMNRMMF